MKNNQEILKSGLLGNAIRQARTKMATLKNSLQK